MRASTLEEIAALTDSMTALRLVRESSSDDDEHDPEGPTLSSEWSRIRGLLLESETQLAEADAALARVADGTYGLCQNCGRPIPPGRLEARPAARLCVPCAS
ncbi:TraR/DksA C4-type zinc finger protein [Herbiconiux sp. CPCC 205763]|uniref:TraR/DksA C4-type zinc finger protein n=1 Tax=Herbiconiux aconitum TaxID=2970913 RepID=A0ABT2GTB7_9MICO|nr:TraR/DksA C4-type zinc finger protein [Herbiconiux aconitum]MCS5718096.1 TraR/DksA C4-type zinc finger protein [Herbiconiux aconitum]